MAGVTVKNSVDWAISSQVPQEWGKGSTTQVYGPDRTMKPHERAMPIEKDGPCVYLIKNLLNNKIYVGSSIKGRRRLTQHKLSLSRGVHVNKYLQYSWDKHGPEAFELSIHEQCGEADRLIREQFWIDTFKSSNPEFGYNVTHSTRSLAPAELRSRISKSYWENMTPAERDQACASRRKLWDDAEWRAAREADLLKKGAKQRARRAADPEFNAKCLAGLERQRANPEAQAQRAAKIRETWATPEVKARQSERKKALVADPVYMEKHKARAASEASKAKLREHNRKQWDDPVIRAKRLEGLRKGAKAFWSDPVKKAERLELLARKRTEAAQKRRNKSNGNDIV
jgi:group I intron endonuclease